MVFSRADCCDECRADPETQSERGFIEEHDDSHTVSAVTIRTTLEPQACPTLQILDFLGPSLC